MQPYRKELKIKFNYENLKDIKSPSIDIVIDTYKNSCCYCGSTTCIKPISLNQQVELACSICYAITHLNKYNSSEFIIAISKLSQLDIVKKTLSLLKIDKKLEYIKAIDPSAKIINMSVIELELLYNSNKNICKNWKVFFNTNFKEIKKYIRRVPIISMRFHKPIDISENVPIYNFSKKEKYQIDEVLYKNIKLTQSGYAYYLNLLKEAPDLANLSALKLPCLK